MKYTFNEGDILVCTTNAYLMTKKGDIFTNNNHSGSSFALNGYRRSGINAISDARHATAKEIDAYRTGIKNIKYIKYELEYEIY